ncbi:unnamed protein product [Vicia faba]|uniref:Uncharacterized protein n=1 Tax=Vicia faba TaxID=3906 RepID=A0AAV1AIL4_VICFA|nr:unnamed protein product [Vicia faba]
MFEVVKFTFSRLPFPKDFPSDYQNLYNRSSLELSSVAEAHLLRIFLIERVEWEKYAKVYDNLKYKHSKVQEALTKLQEVVMTLVHEIDDLKVLFRRVEVEA